jgi:hypothetical protein
VHGNRCSRVRSRLKWPTLTGKDVAGQGTLINGILTDPPGHVSCSSKAGCRMNSTPERCFFCRTQTPTVAVKLMGLFVWICDECHERWRLQKDR